MSEIATEVVNAEEQPKFNVESFVKPSKKDEPKAVETTTEKVVTTTTEKVASSPVVEAEFEVSFDDEPIVETPVTEAPKKNVVESLRSIEQDLKDEEDVVNRYQTLKEENNKLKIVSQGRSIIDKDEDILGWKKATKMSDKDKAETALFLGFKNDGYDDEKAQEKAKKRVSEWEETDVEKIEDEAIRFTSWLNRNIDAKTKHIEEEIVKNTVSFEVDNDVLSKVSKTILDRTEFLGMTLPKDEEKRKKILKDAGDFANSDEFKAQLKDPKVLGDVALFLKHKAQWEKNIKQRGTSKLAIIEKMAIAPSVEPRHITRSQEESKPTGFNPAKFK